MQITMKKSELEQMTGAVKKIFVKVMTELEIGSPINAESLDDMMKVFEKEEVIDSAFATITVTTETITVDVKDIATTNIIELLEAVTDDVLNTVVQNKGVIELVVKSLLGFFKVKVQKQAMFLIKPIMKPAQELVQLLQDRFETFAEKFNQE